MKSEEEVVKIIEDMKSRTKGRYLTQGVAFNKTCPRQMEMLKLALMSSASFSGLIKELLALRFNGGVGQTTLSFTDSKQDAKNIGNFL